MRHQLAAQSHSTSKQHGQVFAGEGAEGGKEAFKLNRLVVPDLSRNTDKIEKE